MIGMTRKRRKAFASSKSAAFVGFEEKDVTNHRFISGLLVKKTYASNLEKNP
jgi:hypothetical protein